jgi:membrane associated rhomboid family serine protease
MRTLPSAPVVTKALIAINVIVFLAETATGAPLGGGLGNGWVVLHGILWGPFISQSHEYWRLLTAGFLHDGIVHIFVNMLSLYFVGGALEPAIGRLNFVAVYLSSLLAGSFGALLFAGQTPVVGASTAIFGIFGALIVVARARGISIWQSGLGIWLVLNLVLSVTFTGISLGGHLGGLVGGLIGGWLVTELGERRGRSAQVLAGCALLAAASVAGAIAVAGAQGLFPHGIGITGS